MSVQTVDDINSNNIMNPVNNVCTIDTGVISEDEFNIVCEFCEISHVFNEGEHLFIFKNITPLWNGRYHIIPSDTVMSDFTVSFSDGVLQVSCFSSSIVLMLYLCDEVDFEFSVLAAYPLDKIIYLDKLRGTALKFHEIDSGREVLIPLNEWEFGWNSIKWDSKEYGCVLCLLSKTDVIFDLNTVNLVAGVVNHVQMNIDELYLPYGALVDGEELDILIKHGDEELAVVYDSNVGDYCFDLDLREKFDEKPVHVTVIVNESENINYSVNDFDLPCYYRSVATFDELKSLIVQGETTISLDNDIVCDTDLFLYDDLYLRGNGCNINLNGHSIVVHEDINVKFDSIMFSNGNPCILQKQGTKLVMEYCDFNNCSISDKYKGSVVSTLNDENIITTFNECIILNSPHSIWHSGSLTLTDCKARYNIFNEDALDPDYSLLLTQYQGEANITGNIFDIDYNTTGLCEQQINLKFAATLISISKTAILNNLLGEKMQDNNTLPLFDNIYNNQSHVYARYYYPSLDECIIISPVVGFEDKNTCHCIIGDNKIYKDNVQITTAESNNQNEIRKITWE